MKDENLVKGRSDESKITGETARPQRSYKTNRSFNVKFDILYMKSQKKKEMALESQIKILQWHRWQLSHQCP